MGNLMELWGLEGAGMTGDEGDETTPVTTAEDSEEGTEEGETTPASTGTKKADKKGAESQTVPYERFKEVNEKAKLSAAEAKELKERLAVLEAQKADGSKPKRTPEQEAFYKTYIEPVVKPLEDKLSKVEEERLIDKAELKIEKELSELKGKHPNMNREYVLAMYLNNPNKSLAELAQESHESTEKERQKWIDEYVKSKKKTPEHQASMPAGGSPSAGNGKPPKEANTFAKKMEWAKKVAIERARNESKQ